MHEKQVGSLAMGAACFYAFQSNFSPLRSERGRGWVNPKRNRPVSVMPHGFSVGTGHPINISFTINSPKERLECCRDTSLQRIPERGSGGGHPLRMILQRERIGR